MKLKSTKYILLTSMLGAATFYSCTDLDEQVFSEVLSSSYQPTEKDLPAIVAPVYSSLRGLMLGWQGYFDLQEESADAIITPVRPNGWDDGGTYRRMHQHTWTSLQWQPENAWQSSFRSITTANRVLSQIADGEIPVTVGKDNVIGELRAVRALAYYLLLDNHGNVPIVTDFKDTSLPKQSTRKEVYDFVVKELTEAIPFLSENAATTYGQMNKWAAKALLAKIYLNAEVYTGTAEWAKAITTADEVIASGKYVLDANYTDIFTWNNFNSKEIIFAIPYDEIYGTGNQIHMKTLDPLSQTVFPLNALPWGGNCAVPQFIDTYEAEDSRLTDTWLMGPQRHATTGAVVITYGKAVPSMLSSKSSDGYRIGKYKIKPNATGSLDNDFPLLRYADVLMIKAEALLRTGKADEAAVIVTEVRKRAFKGNPAKATVTGADLAKGSKYNYGIQAADGTITERQGGDDVKFGRFFDELGWEFAAEAHRRQDMIRFGVHQTKKWFNHSPQPQQRTLFPIPQNELDKNTNLDQNPGY